MFSVCSVIVLITLFLFEAIAWGFCNQSPLVLQAIRRWRRGWFGRVVRRGTPGQVPCIPGLPSSAQGGCKGRGRGRGWHWYWCHLNGVYCLYGLFFGVFFRDANELIFQPSISFFNFFCRMQKFKLDTESRERSPKRRFIFLEDPFPNLRPPSPEWSEAPGTVKENSFGAG